MVDFGDADIPLGRSRFYLAVSESAGTSSSDRTNVTIYRGADTSTNLSAFSATDITMSPAFDSDTLEYTGDFSAGTSQTTVTATPEDSRSRVTISPVDADSITDGHQVNISRSRTTTITAKVESQNGKSSQTYTLLVSWTDPLGLKTFTVAGTFDSGTDYTAGSESLDIYVSESTSDAHTVTAAPTDSSATVEVTRSDSYTTSPTGWAATNSSNQASVDLEPGANFVYARVTNGGQSRIYTGPVTRGSTDSSLASLTISDEIASLTNPTAGIMYDRTVKQGVTSAKVTATVNHSGAMRTITPADSDSSTSGHQIDLTDLDGDEELCVVVTVDAEIEIDTYKSIYTVCIKRSTERLSDDADLKSLSISRNVRRRTLPPTPPDGEVSFERRNAGTTPVTTY